MYMTWIKRLVNLQTKKRKPYLVKIWPVMTSRMCYQWQSFIWSFIGPTGFCSFPGSMSRLACQNGHLNIEMRHKTEFSEIMQNDSVPIEFIFKKIIFVRRAQRTEFNISSKKMSRHIPYCIRSIHVIRFNVLIVYHPGSSNGLPIDIQLELGSLKTGHWLTLIYYQKIYRPENI